MRWLTAIFLLFPMIASGQSSEVLPGELSLEVIVADTEFAPFEGEMLLITIRGVYRRHITRETLKQPDLDGFNWMQLGADFWSEERIRGQKVKILERRMALFPERSGKLTIGAFTHELTLTDESDDWFEHRITSQPIMVEIAPAPSVSNDDWWFPVRALRISDRWSNAPDQLAQGEGVLRVIRLEALGASPEMIPPMPDLTSPSAMIFPHPEKRVVELSPEGPVTYAFWRWTIRPGNDVSAILEPLTFNYFDTRQRVGRTVSISAQRVAYDAAKVDISPPKLVAARSQLPGDWVLGSGIFAFAAATAILFARRRFEGLTSLRRFELFDGLIWSLRRAGWRGDAKGLRRATSKLVRRDGSNAALTKHMTVLDRSLFAKEGSKGIPKGFVHGFLANRRTRRAEIDPPMLG